MTRSTSDSELAVLAQWFSERGFALQFEQDDSAIWANLARLPSRHNVVRRYGQGSSRLKAASSAKQRFQQEQ